jgi:hypothetical protein
MYLHVIRMQGGATSHGSYMLTVDKANTTLERKESKCKTVYLRNRPQRVDRESNIHEKRKIDEKY